MWHSRASSKKKQHFILIHSEFKKTVVAVWSIGAECEAADEGNRLQRTRNRDSQRLFLFCLFSVISFFSHGWIYLFL